MTRRLQGRTIFYGGVFAAASAAFALGLWTLQFSATAQDAPARSLDVKCMRVPWRYHLTIS